MIDRRSRYHGQPVFSHRGRLTLGQRLVGKPDESESFVMHRLGDTETLDQLALRYYGRDDLWWRIADANPATFPLDLEPGDIVRIPLSPRITRLP